MQDTFDLLIRNAEIVDGTGAPRAATGQSASTVPPRMHTNSS